MYRVIRKILNLKTLLFGLFITAGLYSLLMLRCTFTKESKCYIPEILQTDPVYIFVACR